MNQKREERRIDGSNEAFNYTFSAEQQQEIRSIREKYIAPTQEDDKMERLRRLDRSATKPGTIAALCIGVVSTLLLGIGMSCTMVWADKLFALGIAVGVLGIAGMLVTYPVYNAVTKKQREKLAPEIIRLSDDLMK